MQVDTMPCKPDELKLASTKDTFSTSLVQGIHGICASKDNPVAAESAAGGGGA